MSDNGSTRTETSPTQSPTKDDSTEPRNIELAINLSVSSSTIELESPNRITENVEGTNKQPKDEDERTSPHECRTSSDESETTLVRSPLITPRTVSPPKSKSADAYLMFHTENPVQVLITKDKGKIDLRKIPSYRSSPIQIVPMEDTSDVYFKGCTPPRLQRVEQDAEDTLIRTPKTREPRSGNQRDALKSAQQFMREQNAKQVEKNATRRKGQPPGYPTDVPNQMMIATENNRKRDTSTEMVSLYQERQG